MQNKNVHTSDHNLKGYSHNALRHLCFHVKFESGSRLHLEDQPNRDKRRETGTQWFRAFSCRQWKRRARFSERLNRMRSQKKVTMVDVANSLCISKQSVHHWEIKKSLPSAEKLAELADYFDVSTNYLVGRSDNPERR